MPLQTLEDELPDSKDDERNQETDQAEHGEVRWLGKAATFVLYGAIPSFYLVSADVAPWLFGPPAWIAGVVGLFLYWYVGAQYVRDVWVKSGSVESASGTRPTTRKER